MPITHEYVIRSKKGKVLFANPDRKKVVKRMGQIEFFKNRGKRKK